MSCQELSRLTAGPPLQLAELDGDPPDADRGLHWHDREPCPFTREEGEAFGTYVSSDMSRATAPAFRWQMMFCSIDRNLSLFSGWPTWDTSSVLDQALNLALCAYAE